jgi:hypothetical protein
MSSAIVSRLMSEAQDEPAGMWSRLRSNEMRRTASGPRSATQSLAHPRTNAARAPCAGGKRLRRNGPPVTPVVTPLNGSLGMAD